MRQDRRDRKIHPVGEKEPNDFGLHDMHGNVWEWCEDWFQTDYYEESAGASDPLCANSGSGKRIVRGGGWVYYAGGCRSACRGRYLPSLPSNLIGFRPAWSSP